MNAPLLPGSTIGDVAHVFMDLFFPVLERVHPDLIIVSAGQDMLTDDPLSVMGLVPEDYGTLTGLLVDATGLSPAFVLEGGYGPNHPLAINAILDAVEGKRNRDPLPGTFSLQPGPGYGFTEDCTALQMIEHAN